MARKQNANTFAKRRREIQKKQKAEDKRARRRKKKEEADNATEPTGTDHPSTDE